MVARLFIILLTVVCSCLTTVAENVVKDNQPFNGWNDERVKEYEDSVLNATYPPVNIFRLNPDSLPQRVSVTGPRDISLSDDIDNPYVPNSVTLDYDHDAPAQVPLLSGISPNGAKTYEIPIEAYPGMNGFTPELKLTYNSQQTGDGLIGIGWVLSGLSQITREGKTVYYDGKNEGVRYDNNDPFSLNGVRLIKTAETADSIRYQTVQGNIIVTGHIHDGALVCFDAYFPDGNHAVFGYPDDTSAKSVYPVTSLTDINGNTATYQYDYVLNNYYITKISYQDAWLEFGYSYAPDKQRFYYRGGVRVGDTRYLKVISIGLGIQELRQYSLEYVMKNGRGLLSNVRIRVWDGLPTSPVKFLYGEGEDGFSLTTSTTLLSEWYEPNKDLDPAPSMMNALRTVKGKFDYGSGDDGLIVLPNKNPYWVTIMLNGKEYKYIFKNNYTGQEKIFLYTGLSSGDYVSPMPNLVTEEGFVDLLCADIEGKQEESIIKINDIVTGDKKSVLTFSIYKSNIYNGLSKVRERKFEFDAISETYPSSNESITVTVPKFFYVGDFDGDGRQEVLMISAHNPLGISESESYCLLYDLHNGGTLYRGKDIVYKRHFIGVGQESDEAENKSDRIIILDYNGDGKSDICHINEEGTHIYSFESTDGGLKLNKVSTFKAINKANLKNCGIYAVELNGDGCTDLIKTPERNDSYSTATWHLYNSKGDGQFEYSTFIGPNNPDNDDSGFIMQDVNGDGLTDMIKYDRTKFTTYLATTENKFVLGGETVYPYKNSVIVPTNINSHNSFTQLVALCNGNVTRYSVVDNFKKSSLLTGVVSSLGAIEKNRYEIIGGNDDVYSMGADAVFPYVNINEQLPVLVASETWLKGKKIESRVHSYENAVMHRQGLGFCGFSKVTTRNSRGEWHEQYYDPYRFGVKARDRSFEHDNSMEYSVEVSPEKFFKIDLTKKIENDLLKETSCTTTYTYDSYGYPVNERSEYSDGIIKEAKTNYRNQSNRFPGYNLGYPLNRIVTVTRGNSVYEEKVTEFPAPLKRYPRTRSFYIDGNLVKREGFTYDTHGNVLSESVRTYLSSNALQTTYEYDGMGRKTKETNPMGLTNQYTYDRRGKLSTITDHLGGLTTYNYDSFGRETKVTNPDGTEVVTAYSWSRASLFGDVYSVTLAQAGRPTTLYYDGLNREVCSEETRFDGKGLRVERQYGENGEVSQVSLPYTGARAYLKWNTYTYDRYNRLFSINEASGRTTVYRHDRTSVTTEADGISVTRDYDTLGNMVSATDAGGTVTYEIAADGKPISITAPGNAVTAFGYDRFRRRVSMDEPAHGLTTYEYDTAGNISKETDANGNVTEYSYDVYNRITERNAPDISVSYTYDTLGQLISVNTGDEVSQSFNYDSFGRVSARFDFAPDKSGLYREYTYNDGNISGIYYYDADKRPICSEYRDYANGHLTGITLNDSTAIYRLQGENTLGQTTRIQTGKLTRNYTYDDYGYPRSRLVSLPYTIDIKDPIPMLPDTREGTFGLRDSLSIGIRDPIIIDSIDIPHKEVHDYYRQWHAYSFDRPTGNLLSRTDKLRDRPENFEYDGLNRLTSFKYATAEYDDKGNLTYRKDVGTLGYDVPGNPYAVSSVTLAKDAVPLRSQAVTYTSFKRPATISENDNHAVFSYNGGFDRTKMCITGPDGKETLVRWYAGGCYEKEHTPKGGTTERLYLGGSDYYDAVAVLVRKGNDVRPYYILRDYLGSITEVIDSAGMTVEARSYDAWGRQRNPLSLLPYAPDREPSLFLGRGYTGHEYLPMFGLINMNARLYDPALGRFLSPDPYVSAPDFTQSFNRYSYANNNPLRYVDPDGEIPVFLIGALIGGALNLGYKALKGEIHSWGDGFKAFGIGAVAGAVGGWTGGWAFGIAGGGVGGAGAGGFIAGASSGAVAGFTTSMTQNTLNHYAFGDPWMTDKEILGNVFFGAATGGLINGSIAAYHGRNFFTGNYSAGTATSTLQAPKTSPDANPKEVGTSDTQSSQSSQSSSQTTSQSPKEYIHYTTEEGYKQIMESKELLPSLDPKHARFGQGQYFTDLNPSEYTAGQVSRRLFGVPWCTSKVQYHIRIDLSGLNVINNVPGNYLVPNTTPLNIQNRIIDGGISVFRLKF